MIQMSLHEICAVYMFTCRSRDQPCLHVYMQISRSALSTCLHIVYITSTLFTSLHIVTSALCTGLQICDWPCLQKSVLSTNSQVLELEYVARCLQGKAILILLIVFISTSSLCNAQYRAATHDITTRPN